VVAAELGRNRSMEDIKKLVVYVTDETGSEVFRTKLVNLQERTSADEIVRTARRGSGNEPSH
jgi:hypothetical protein